MMELPVKMYITGVYSAPRELLKELMEALIAAHPVTYQGNSLYNLMRGDGTGNASAVIALKVCDGRREWYLTYGAHSWNQGYTMTWQEAYSRYCSYNDN
jgi:hypothetical protein